MKVKDFNQNIWGEKERKEDTAFKLRRLWTVSINNVEIVDIFIKKHNISMKTKFGSGKYIIR